MQLGLFAETADNDGGAQIRTGRQFAEGLRDLKGELAGRRKNQRLDGRAAFWQVGGGVSIHQPFENGQQEGERFAGAGLGGGDYV